jgi:hypothetical protein
MNEMIKQLNPTEKEILNVFLNWEYKQGEFKEALKILAMGLDAISNVSATVYSNHIEYQIILTPKGIQSYLRWCRENDYTPNLLGKNNILIYDDEDEESIRETLYYWGEQWEDGLNEAEQILFNYNWSIGQDYIKGQDGKYHLGWGTHVYGGTHPLTPEEMLTECRARKANGWHVKIVKA